MRSPSNVPFDFGPFFIVVYSPCILASSLSPRLILIIHFCCEEINFRPVFFSKYILDVLPSVSVESMT